jgi:ABC-2 type transport system permease protein
MARLAGAAMGQVPAALVIVAVAALALGLLPRACVAIGWSGVGLAVLISIFGQALQLSHWVLDVSPFTHAPGLPGGTVAAPALTWLCVLGTALCAAGLAGLRRRDIG